MKHEVRASSAPEGYGVYFTAQEEMMRSSKNKGGDPSSPNGKAELG